MKGLSIKNKFAGYSCKVFFWHVENAQF